MADRVLIYISAATDLEPEREALGKAVTEVPVTLAWRVVQTPRAGEPLDLAAAAQADIHILLLGSDIRAPVGLEWMAARQASRLPILFLKSGTSRTPAAAAFIHEVEQHATWLPFQDLADLRRQVLALLGDHILKRADYYVLRPAELESLVAWRENLDKKSPPQAEEPRGGAGASAVVLSTERFTPSEGVLIDPGGAGRKGRNRE